MGMRNWQPTDTMTMISKHIQAPSVKPSLTRILCLSLFGLSILTGCATTPPPTPTTQEAPPEVNASAEALMRHAASLPADQAAALYLQAAWAFLEADDHPGAERAYMSLEPGWLSQEVLPDYHLLSATLELSRGELAAARQSYAMLPLQMRGSDRALRLASALCAAEGEYSCALKNLIRSDGDDPAANAEIWRLLGAELDMKALEMPSMGTDPVRLSEWRTLHRAVVAPFSLGQSQAAVVSWLDAHPDHPAALIPPEPVSALLAARPEPLQIALLLPLTGPLARAGEAVRDGFIAASLMAGSSAHNSSSTSAWLTLNVYDSAAEPMPLLYERLLAEGADLIVGPLQKSAATALNALNPELPILVLNYLDPDAIAAPELNQFGLAIEDEATTISQRLVNDGIERVLLFHNYDDWSLRGRRTLSDEAAAGNAGVQLTVQPITDMRTITEAVGNAMHVSGSRTRRDELANLLGVELEFLPRAREDVDAVVALVDNTEANALVPALRFHFANHLPVYASSQVARRARPGQLKELDGFHVSELPYFLTGDPVHAAMAAPFNLDDNPFAPLIALGSDAFRLTERRQLADETGELILVGSTGLLKRQPNGRVARELAWGIVKTGMVRPEWSTSTDTSAAASRGDL